MTSLERYGYKESEALPDGCIAGRVIEQQRGDYTVMTNHGEVTAQLKGSFIYDAVVRSDLPCVGDFVAVKYNESGPSMITAVLPRRTKFSRHDGTGHSFAHVKGNREQMVAANFDYVFILTSLNRDYNVGRILRYLTQTWASGGMPVILLTKADMIDDCTPYLNELEAAAPGVNVHAISSHTGQGLDALAQYLQPGKTVVFMGMSGVGKSSLLNALAEYDLMAVKATRKVDAAKGQHTTTSRHLFLLPSGALVMDTPGMRELGLLDEGNLDEVIGANFAEIEELVAQCRFSDCQHESEPDCAIQVALAEGTITPARWRQYRIQQKEISRTNRNNFVL
ncbi:MAG: ribosome small subunit-dependent GTPase A [Defluviitaleaceae bacterium]|nr:ribosome small subunit-dependent GTPase A [Defluviitaleaceae bacterium]